MSDGAISRAVPRAGEGPAPEKWPGLGEIVVTGASTFVQKRPVISAFWVFGVLLAFFANGFPVEEIQRLQYEQSIDQADHVTKRELKEAYTKLRHAEDAYYNSKGWFSCDQYCMENYERVQRTQQRVDMVEAKREGLIKDARSAVGVFSTYGVGEVRRRFWNSWDDGKSFASRWTMYDAMFAMMSSRRDETLATVVLNLFVKYISNLTVGLCASTVFFFGAMVNVVQSFGPSFIAGLGFFLLVVVATLATLATFFTALYGTIGGAVYMGMKHVAENPHLLQDAQNRRQQQRRMHYHQD